MGSTMPNTITMPDRIEGLRVPVSDRTEYTTHSTKT